jgi:hypothetical protein
MSKEYKNTIKAFEKWLNTCPVGVHKELGYKTDDDGEYYAEYGFAISQDTLKELEKQKVWEKIVKDGKVKEYFEGKLNVKEYFEGKLEV